MRKIAILLSTYNGRKYIKEQMDSIVNQTVANDIVVYVRDDGSSDDTIRVIEQYKNQLDIRIEKGKNVGPAKSFWQLLIDDSIEADYYAFCDQDDVWDSDKIECGLAALLDYNQKPALWCSNCRIIDSSGKILQHRMNDVKPDFSIVSQIICGTIQGCAMLLNNELRRFIKGKKITNIPMHDFVLITYAYVNGTIIYDNIPHFSYRVHANNVVANMGKQKIKHYTDTIKHWFSSKSKYEYSKFAKEFYDNNMELIDEETKMYLLRLSNAKNSIKDRIFVVRDNKTNSVNKKAERSYKIRTLLGMI